MTVKALMPVRSMNLVVPLAHEATDMRTTGTAASAQVWPGAVSPVIGSSLRRGDVDCTNDRRPVPVPPGTRTSTTATRTPTTCPPRVPFGLSADSSPPFAFEELLCAYIDCRRNKRNTASALAFEARLEYHLMDLYEELCSGQYRPGPSVCFVVMRPKPREVWAARFRDRIVHWLLYNRIAPHFHARFVAGSCACIPGRGTLYAGQRLEHDVRSVSRNWSRPAHYLQCDLANFFVSISKAVLWAHLAPGIADRWWLDLAHRVLFHDPREDVEVRGSARRLALVPAHKSLFNAAADTGLPIGNLSSQFFANVLLNPLDQLVKHKLRIRHYVRYVDDFVLLHESSHRLGECLRAIEIFLPAQLGLHLNPAKTIRQPVDRGIDFVGHLVKPWRRTTRRRTLSTALQRMESIPDAEVFATGNSYLGHVRQASHSHRDLALLCRALLKRGYAVEGRHLSKVFRKAQ